MDVEEIKFVAKRKLQIFFDRITPLVLERWIAFQIVLTCFLLRCYFKRGFAVIAYILGLFYLNNIMLYLSPVEDDGTLYGSEYELPTRENDEYKGF